ncbi:MAG: ice-binding family protein [Thermoanaerobaculia bacterium]
MKTRFEKAGLSVWMTTILGILAALPAQAAGPNQVDLAMAGTMVILAESGISTTGVTSIVGNIGVSPIAATAITGFDLILDPSGTFSTSSLIEGMVFASDYATPTPRSMRLAVADMEIAYTDAAGRTLPDFTELYSGDLTSQTLTPGLYKWGTGVLISAGGVTLSGSPTDVWIFQIAQDLTLEAGAIVTLAGGASAANIFWQVAGQTNLGTTTRMKGIVLCATQIAMTSGATLVGRALAQTAVTLDGNSIYMAAGDNSIFIDGFETNDTSRWSATLE